MKRKLCTYWWPGDLFGCCPHSCARPPGHENGRGWTGHMCYCGEQPGDKVKLHPWRAMARGLPYMFDFFGVLSGPETTTAEEAMAEAWAEVLAVVKPPPERTATCRRRKG